jgi:SAM-dependent methyltransferase
VPGGPSTNFDAHSDSYRQEIEEAISFVGADLDLFTRLKADELLGLAQRVGTPDHLAFLDVGCGVGETDRFLQGRVGRLTGVDVAPMALERARASNPGADDLNYTEGQTLPVPGASFDVCFAICVLHHVPRGERAALVGEMRRVCRPGGLVAIFEHNPFNPLTRRAVSGCEFDRDAELLSRREALRLLSSAGMPHPEGRYVVFFPREGRLLRGVERRLSWLPLGAQYAAFAQRA